MIPVPSVRDVEIFEALTNEQRRAAGLLVLNIARELFDERSDNNDRITHSRFWDDGDDCDGFSSRLRDAGFPV